ncbi:MAG TPA: DinB family protein [Chloroflexota bacterium]|nr:DinB family protein [Chloroflexota bacterium]
MPGTVRPVVDERDGLLAFLAQQRDGLRFAVHGLTDEQATSKPTVSALSLAGLIKHAARVERYWIVGILAQRPLPEMQTQDYEAGFRLEAGETLASVLDNYAATAAETEAIIGAIPDMGQPVPVPKGVPWFPQDVEAWSVRWVLLHLIQETARHAGHADIIRESLDGQTMYELMAASEGWLDDLKRWQAEYASGQE